MWCDAVPVVPAVLQHSKLFQAGRNVERIQQGYVFDLLQVYQAILPIVPAILRPSINCSSKVIRS